MKVHGHFHSVEALANFLSHDHESVSLDVKAVASADLILVREAVLSGHGNRFEIAPGSLETYPQAKHLM